MSDQENMARLAEKGTILVANTTKYLSTLPHPIEVLEELIAVTAVTSSLLTSLSWTISRFPACSLDPTASFVKPLCEAIEKAFQELETKFEESRQLEIFEPNEAGLVRIPCLAWNMVMGGESKAQALRSRLYVEKYKVRVLIEAVTWYGLKHTANSRELSELEVGEFRALSVLLPLIAERCIGVHREYSPRLKRHGGAGEMMSMGPGENLKNGMAMQAFYSTRAGSKVAIPSVQVDLKVLNALKTLKLPVKSSRLGFRTWAGTESVAHTCSSSQSLTTTDDSILETWLLRSDIPKNMPMRRISLDQSVFTSDRDKDSSSYIDHRPSATFRTNILQLDEDAVREIQKLIETREVASASHVKRSFEVAGIAGRPRRKLPSYISSFRRKAKFLAPWVLIMTTSGASIPPTTPVIDSSDQSGGGSSAGDIISAVSVAVVGTVIWHCVKGSSNRRPYLVISLLVSGWIYSMVLNHSSGLLPISSLWIYILLNTLESLRLDMVDLKLGLSYGISVALVGSLLTGALSPFAPDTHYLTYFPHAIVVCMIMSGIAIRTVRLVVGSLSPNAARTIQPWLPQAMVHHIRNTLNDVQSLEEGSATSTGRIAAIEDSRV